MWPAAAALAVAVALGAAVVWAERRALLAGHGNGKPAFHKGMQEHEYLPLIPREELRRIKALLKRIHTARGWQGTPLEVEQAWAQALQAARTPAGGAWADMFQPEDLQPARLQRLASVLDEVFLSGALSRRLRRLKQRPLGFVVDDDFPGVCDWLSYFAEDNHIHLLRRKWSQDVSEVQPMSCEGTTCSTRLQLLMHTVAHEMVHAVVLNYWPDIDQGSPAYLPVQRHGPIFKLLNKRLFGHASDSYHHVFTPLAQTSPAC